MTGFINSQPPHDSIIAKFRAKQIEKVLFVSKCVITT